jgi:two-component system, OmpR family, catabolic regulation response regulator CreB
MPLTILIVEDEPAIAETLLYASKEAGHTAIHKPLGQEAIHAAEQQVFDFVILDVGLPDMSGFDVCKKIRRHSAVPILFLTARNQEIDRIVGLEIGADDYVTKPFSPREVIARVHAILRRGQLRNTEPVQSPFKLDEMACTIEYCGTLLNLTRYEYLLLKTLINQPKRVFSRPHLMDIVWQQADDTLERTVDTHIKTVRAKLRQIKPDAETIITHRGMGYSLQNNA